MEQLTFDLCSKSLVPCLALEWVCTSCCSANLVWTLAELHGDEITVLAFPYTREHSCSVDVSYWLICICLPTTRLGAIHAGLHEAQLQ